MNSKIRLTKRGKIVRNVVITLIAVAVFVWLNDVTTPEACKVPVEQMSAGCKRLLFP